MCIYNAYENIKTLTYAYYTKKGACGAPKFTKSNSVRYSAREGLHSKYLWYELVTWEKYYMLLRIKNIFQTGEL